MDTLTPLALGSIKALLLLVVAATAALALRRAPARLRAVVWATALGGCLLIPVAAPLVPTLAVPLPASLTALASASDPPVLASGPDTAAPMAARRAAASVHRAHVPPAPHEPLRIPWQPLLLLTWAGGAMVLAARLGVGLRRVSRLMGRAHSITDGRWLDVLDRARATVGCRRGIRLLSSPEVEVPATVGWLRPTIVLPSRAATWLDDRRRAVLLHEVIHVARLDWPQRLVARLARAVYWFNPLVWWAVCRLDLEQELACDEEVLSFGTGASDYACHLLGIARHALPCPQPAIPALGMARRTHLEERIMSILERARHRRVGVTLLAPAILLTAALVPALAAVAPSDPVPRPANSELKAIVAELKAAEERIEPQLAALAEIEIDMEPQLAALEDLEIEIDTEKIAEIERRMEPYLERIRDIEIDMAPLQEQMEALEEQLQRVEFHVQDGTIDAIHKQIQEQMTEHLAGIESIHANLEPYLAEIESIHEEMAHLHEQLADVHVDMEPVRAQMEKIHIDMEPFHEQMEAVQRQMEPFHAEMERLGERLDEAVREEVASYLRSQLGAVVSPEAAFDEAAEKIVADARIHIDDGNLEVDASRRETREILADLFEPARAGTEYELQAAIEAAAEGLAPLVIQVD